MMIQNTDAKVCLNQSKIFVACYTLYNVNIAVNYSALLFQKYTTIHKLKTEI